MAALVLNGKPMAAQKGNRFSNDLWSIKHVPELTWNDLLEKVNFEKNSKEQRIKAEIEQVNKVHNFIVGQTSKAQTRQFREKRKIRKQRRASPADTHDPSFGE